ncbi:response regulator transcription factor [Longispora sp. K20-0274]|uniref:response regulator transcription factor n=1 Tax=Longispora sp. K20-0274 TaxID=3088255 RepID=UPI00399AB105
MPRVLVIEDEPGIRHTLLRELGAYGHSVQAVGSAMAGLRAVTGAEPDVVLLDLGLPDLDGAVLLTMIRASTQVPVIVATARDDERDMVRLLDQGADDYVIKPFSVEQIAARVRAVLRRTLRDGPTPPLVLGALTVDPTAREARLDGVTLPLSRREFDLLAYLAARPGQVVTRKQLLAEVWRFTFSEDDGTVDVHLSWLRRKLGETAAAPRYLHTVRGVGIKLIARPEG